MFLKKVRPHAPTLVVVGGGFAGIDLINSVPDSAPLNIVLIDRHNYHTFQPLLYQVATGGLDAGSIAYPLRKVFAGRRNVSFRMASVESVDPGRKVVRTSIGDVAYDRLVLATGSDNNFFGNADFAENCLPVKSVPNAIDLRSSFLFSLEKAISATDEEEIEKYTTFVVIGGGATGVELAGALSELRRVVVPSDYPELRDRGFKIVLVQGDDRLLPNMSEKASAVALGYLRRMGVEVMLDVRVESYDGDTVVLPGGRRIRSDTVVWAAGVQGRPVAGLPEGALGTGKRFKVDEFNRVVGVPDVFAVGDVALMGGDPGAPKGHPQVAPVAKQQGVHLAKNIVRDLAGRPMRPFRYHDKGQLAVIGRNRAVADFGSWSFRGFFAWLLWAVVHLLFLVGFRNKVITTIDWVWNYVSYERFVRLILRPVQKPKAAARGVEVMRVSNA